MGESGAGKGLWKSGFPLLTASQGSLPGQAFDPIQI